MLKSLRKLPLPLRKGLSALLTPPLVVAFWVLVRLEQVYYDLKLNIKPKKRG